MVLMVTDYQVIIFHEFLEGGLLTKDRKQATGLDA